MVRNSTSRISGNEHSGSVCFMSSRVCVYLHGVKQGYHNLSKIASLLSVFSFSK